MGIAFDGDFDRCFLFDELGNFIEGYYIVGLLAEAFLQKHPESKIIHDPRLSWNTIEVVQKMPVVFLLCQKQAMPLLKNACDRKMPFMVEK